VLETGFGGLLPFFVHGFQVMAEADARKRTPSVELSPEEFEQRCSRFKNSTFKPLHWDPNRNRIRECREPRSI
jgi:hypothetical protein